MHYKTHKGIFHFRIAGILIKNGKILVQRGINDDAYALPGGHVEMFERTEETLIREFKEEIGVNIKVKRLLWIQEQMAEWNQNKHHSLNFYYLIDYVGNNIPLDDCFYSRKDNDSEIEFSWIDIDEIKNMNFYPVHLKNRLNHLPNTIERFVEQEIK